MALAKLISDQHDAIIRRFVDEVRRGGGPPPGTSSSGVLDHIPFMLDDVIDELQRRGETDAMGAAAPVAETARRHGVQRWELGFDLDALVRDYRILRHCILMMTKESNTSISIDELDVLANCVDVAVAQAVTAYIAHQNEEREAAHERIAFLAECGRVLSSSLDSTATSTRITRLVIPRLADWCVVHLVDRVPALELPAAHIDPEKVALLREVFAHLELPEGAQVGPKHVIASGARELVADTAAPGLRDDLGTAAYLASLDRLGTTSLLTVPLRVQRASFGALTLGFSDSKRHFTETEVVLAEDLCGRAAVAIENAHLYEQSNRARARVEAATRAKDEFVAMISHELRTPLNAILGWARMLRRGGLAEDKATQALAVIERNAEAQSQLVADLLDVSKILRGTARIVPAQLDLRDLVEMAIEGIRPGADAKRITVEAELEGGDAILRGDADRLRQVVWNLLSNAVKFTPKEGRVRVALRRVDSDLELVVEDTGVGISPEFLPHMFDSFRQSDSSATRTHGGLGVGLSIAKHFVTLHGGSVVGESEGPGRGARFVVRLPVSNLVSTSLGVRRTPAVRPIAAATLPEGLAGLRVLVVDDEPDARGLLQVVLEACDVDVCVAASAEAALHELERFVPDVMISDIGMADGDGYALIAALRAHPAEAMRQIPAIALTAYGTADDRTRALLAGFNLHATKPADPSALVMMVADLAGRRASGGSG